MREENLIAKIGEKLPVNRARKPRATLTQEREVGNRPPLPIVDDALRLALYGELIAMSGKTRRLENPTEDHARRGSFYLGKYRILPIDIPRRTDAQARKYLFGDLREKTGLSIDRIIFLVEMGQRAQPNEHAASAREEDARITLAGAPKAIEISRPPRPGISGIMQPGQDMADWIII